MGRLLQFSGPDSNCRGGEGHHVKHRVNHRRNSVHVFGGELSVLVLIQQLVIGPP